MKQSGSALYRSLLGETEDEVCRSLLGETDEVCRSLLGETDEVCWSLLGETDEVCRSLLGETEDEDEHYAEVEKVFA